LYGRGSVDAKGPLAAFVAAAARAEIPRGRRVTVVGAVEEEAATSKGARALLGGDPPVAVVIGEPSGWDRITVGYKGRLLVDYRLERDVGHTAGPETSVCEEAVSFWQSMVDDADRYNGGTAKRMFDTLAPSLRAICSSSDGFVERVEMTMGYRLPLEIELAELEGRLKSAAGDATLHLRGYEPAYKASRATPLARALHRAISAQGGRPAFKVKSGTSDMNVVGPVWGCPIVAYGPGDSTLDHTPQEHIDLDEYRASVAVLARLIETI
jgi:LysW-gamma-L-lysine carboxypeptidase